MAGEETYAVTIERGTDGTVIAWLDRLPGCVVRGASREDVLERLPPAIESFLRWTGAADTAPARVRITEEVESAIRTDEDTEVLVAVDRRELTPEDWELLEGWLTRSRAELLELLARLDDEALEQGREGSSRTLRAEVEHVGFVELMYASWTFDLRSRRGLAEFLAWTRSVATERLRSLSERRSDDLTWADWGGAPQLEPWTARKAARRLVWHELLHLRALECGERQI